MRPSLRAAAFLAVGTALLLSACTGSGEQGGSGSHPSTTDRSLTAADARLARLLIYETDDAAEYDLTEQLIKRCMTRADLPYDVNEYQPDLVMRTGETNSLAQRQERGFGYAVQAQDLGGPPSGSDPENTAHWNELGDRWIEALEACESGASVLPDRATTITGSLTPKDRSTLGSLEKAYVRERSAGQGRWSSCMDDAGFEFDDQEQMHASLEEDADRDGALEAEIAAAVADARCDDRVFGEARSELLASIIDRVGGTERFGDPYLPDWKEP